MTYFLFGKISHGIGVWMEPLQENIFQMRQHLRRSFPLLDD
jgi:hypothetical protein